MDKGKLRALAACLVDDGWVIWRGEVYDLYMVGVEKSVVVKPYMSELVSVDNSELEVYSDDTTSPNSNHCGMMLD